MDTRQNRNRVTAVGNEREWVRTPAERSCGRCGAPVESWALRKADGHRVAEATFCLVCTPDVAMVFATHDQGEAAA
ncbi:MAG: hypothetical protein ACE5IQ_03570 [Candidatus Methylomirabilales bacterium]